MQYIWDLVLRDNSMQGRYYSPLVLPKRHKPSILRLRYQFLFDVLIQSCSKAKGLRCPEPTSPESSRDTMDGLHLVWKLHPVGHFISYVWSYQNLWSFHALWPRLCLSFSVCRRFCDWPTLCTNWAISYFDQSNFFKWERPIIACISKLAPLRETI